MVVLSRTILLAGASAVSLLGAAHAALAQASPASPPVNPSAATPAPAPPLPVTTEPPAAPAPAAVSPPGAASTPGVLGEVVVTARRRAESVQTTPVSVTALSAQTLTQKGVVDLASLQSLVPGVVLTGGGTNDNSTYAIRGQTRNFIGSGLPSVVSYLNEVPLPGLASNLPTYDVSNIQVLKGPQGTLFGRNTTGGAVLLYSAPATYDFGGYLQGTLGSYDWVATEGAVNLPLVDHKLALRVAFQTDNRDGYTHLIPINVNSDNLNDRNGRITLLAEPFSWLKSNTVVDYRRSYADTPGVIALGPTPDFSVLGGAVFLGSALVNSGFGCNLTAPTAACTPSVLAKAGADSAAFVAEVNRELALQKTLGVRTGQADVVPTSFVESWGVSNTTTANLGPVTVKNIFGYRSFHEFATPNTDGLSIPLLNVKFVNYNSQVSDELQLSGTLLNRKIEWLLGGFYVDNMPDGPQAEVADVFRPPQYSQSIWPLGDVGNSFYSDKSYAVFGNVIYDLSDITDVLRGARLNAGIRQTWDNEGLCADQITFSDSMIQKRRPECQQTPGFFDSAFSSTATTYTVGADYRLTKDIFLYVTSRRGYRAGGINAPDFTGTVLEPYQYYQPQTVTDVEVGAKTTAKFHDINFLFDIDYYHSNFQKVQLEAIGVSAPALGLTATNQPFASAFTLNAGKETTEGVEFNGVISPFRGLNLNYGVSYLDETFNDVNVPADLTNFVQDPPNPIQAPRWTVSASVDYTLPLPENYGPITFSYDFYHTDSFFYGFLANPGYDVSNLQISWHHIMGSDVSLTGFVNNLFNAAYLANSDLSGSGEGIFSANYAPPRMGGVRIRYDF